GWIIQHLIANTGYGGGGPIEDGGNKIVYAASNKLRLSYSQAWTVGSGEKEKTVGLVCHWKILFSNLGCMPNDEVESYIRFNKGIDDIQEFITLGLDIGVIDKGGAWYNWDENKFQGQEKLYEFFEKDPTALDKLKINLSDLYNFKF
ncbi:MAG: hypothetical protein AABY22_27770, partial [Nanoarchaeota archaeon]